MMIWDGMGRDRIGCRGSKKEGNRDKEGQCHGVQCCLHLPLSDCSFLISRDCFGGRTLDGRRKGLRRLLFMMQIPWRHVAAVGNAHKADPMKATKALREGLKTSSSNVRRISAGRELTK